MDILRLILFPFSILYGAVVIIRNLLFDIHLLKSYRSSIPVISVGNITTGGTGKTPVVILLTEILTGLGKSVCVISRGYGRNSKGLVPGYGGKGTVPSAEETGDELSMVINRFSKLEGRFFAIADSDRVNAVKYAEKNFKPDVIILDDAYQHRYIWRNIDIVVVSAGQDSISYKTLLPAGNLREPLSCLCRADLIIRNNKFSVRKSQYPLNMVPEIQVTYIAEGFFNAENKTPDNGSKNYYSISGIADNDSFTDFIKQIGFTTLKDFKFNDHHKYTPEDIGFITGNSGPDAVFLTTEKDFIKLKNFANFTEKNNLYFLKLNVQADREALMNALKEKNIL